MLTSSIRVTQIATGEVDYRVATISIENNTLSIQLSTLDAILAWHGSLHIPLEHISGARVENQPAWDHLWRKIIGTNAPGLKMAGTFWIDGGLAFVDYSSGDNCVVIDTAHETYKHIIVQPDAGADAAAIAAEINTTIATATVSH